jgi:hypothetical protein
VAKVGASAASTHRERERVSEPQLTVTQHRIRWTDAMLGHIFTKNGHFYGRNSKWIMEYVFIVSSK